MENGEASVIHERDEGESKLKKLGTLVNKRNLIRGMAAAIVVTVFSMTTLTSLAVEGTVTAESVNIRKETSTDSEVVGSTVKGKKIDILEAVKDGSGTIWYKVSVSGGGYGYIRSDCVEAGGTIQVSENSSVASDTGSTAKPAETVPTSIGEQPAVISSNSNVNVRAGASTSHNVVISLPNGTPITLIGEASDSQGRKWYQITCNYNGRAIEGYVLENLTAPGTGESAGGESSEPVEGEVEGGEAEGQEGNEGENYENTPEEGAGDVPVTEPVEEHKDYEIAYVPNEAGEYDYYFYNYLADPPNQQKVSNLLTVVDDYNKSQEQLKNNKIIIIILALVIIILFIVITVLLFKIRELYYDYEEEEEEEEEEEPVPVKKRVKKRIEEEEEVLTPVKKKKPAPSTNEERPARAAKAPKREREEKELHAAEMKEPVKKPITRRPQNFLIDDDEFEFEFLNMDDKEL